MIDMNRTDNPKVSLDFRLHLQTLFWLAPPGFLTVIGFWFFQDLGEVRAYLFAMGAVAAWTLMTRSSGELEGRPLTYREAPGLYDAVRTLSLRAGLSRIPRLVLLPGSLINAAASLEAGGTLYVTGGLLGALDWREVKAVLAHEISHLKHGDLWVSRIWESSLLGFQTLALGAFWFLPLTLPELLILTILVALVPPVFRLILAGFLRVREYEADRGAALLSKDPLALAQALAKIEYRKGRPWWWPLPETRMDRTHPDSALRIRRLLSLDGHIGHQISGWVA